MRWIPLVIIQKYSCSWSKQINLIMFWPLELQAQMIKLLMNVSCLMLTPFLWYLHLKWSIQQTRAISRKCIWLEIPGAPHITTWHGTQTIPLGLKLTFNKCHTMLILELLKRKAFSSWSIQILQNAFITIISPITETKKATQMTGMM